MRRLAGLVLLGLVVLVAGPQGGAGAQQAPGTPFGFQGQDVTSPDGVAYTKYSGDVPSFDGLPLAADVTVPQGATGPLPLVVMFHGYTQDRTYWQSETVDNQNPIVDGWNNVAFAKRGYAVLNYTIRGFHDSCGPADAANPGDPATLPADCLGKEYWIHLADPKYEIRDAQFLIGKLVDDGVVDPQNIGVTGQSYGGGHSWLLALQNDRTVNLDGSVSDWTSPQGTPLSIEVAAPMYTWSSLTNALLPNGRARDTSEGSRGTLNDPVGVPIQSYLAALNGGGAATGFYSPPGVDPATDLTSWFARYEQGDPYRNDSGDPVVQRAIQELDRRSPLYVEPNARVPIYQVSGLTDPLFPPVQAVQMLRHVRGAYPDYPIKSYFGDVGHENAANPQDQWDVAHAAGNAFIDHYLKGAGARPNFDVTAQTTRCLPGQTRRTYRAPGFLGLATGQRAFEFGADQTTSNAAGGQQGAAADPIGKQGCLTVEGPRDAGVASWGFRVREPFTLVGQPRISLDAAISGADAQLDVRIWDRSPDGSLTLVSRGTYRHQGATGRSLISYQTSANAWQFQRGHAVRIEVTGNDAPYYRPNNQRFTARILNARVAFPARP